jgi:hypothetical protein
MGRGQPAMAERGAGGNERTGGGGGIICEQLVNNSDLIFAT